MTDDDDAPGPGSRRLPSVADHGLAAREGERRRTSLTTVALLVVLLGTTLFGAISLGWQLPWRSRLPIVVTILLTLAGLAATRAGRVRAVSRGLVLVCGALGIWGMATGGGMASPALTMCFIAVLLAGLLLDEYATWLTATALLAAAALVAFFEVRGDLPPPAAAHPPWARFVGLLMTLGGMTVLVVVSTRLFASLAQRLEADGHAVRRANHALERRVDQQAELARLARAVMAEPDVMAALDSIARSLETTVGAPRISVHLSPTLPNMSLRLRDQSMDRGSWSDLDDAVRGPGVQFLENGEELHGKLARHPAERLLIAPVRSPRGHYGLVTAAFDGDAADTADGVFLQGVASIVASAIERSDAETRLREAEENLAGLVRSAPDGMASMDLQGRILFGNPRFYELLGLPPSDVRGRRLTDLVTVTPPSVRALLEAPATSSADSWLPTTFERRDGRTLHGELNVKVVERPHDRTEGDLVFRDRTDQVEAESREADLEKQLREARRLEAIGQLAGGVAHDFNNLLTIILSNVQLMGRLDLTEAAREGLQEVESGARRAAELTHQLLTFARRQPIKPRAVRLPDTVREMNTLLRRLLRANTSLKLQLGACGPILIDPAQLEQVLLNLVANARDAMPDGGVLTIATRELEVPGPDGARARRAILSVTDTGTGMDEVIRDRIFDPFFTTKATGQGTGLGLATVYGIVQQHGGTIEVKTRPGAGTTLQVEFPVIDEEAGGPSIPDDAPDAPDGASTRSAPGRQRTVLVVDDELGVRTVIQRILELEGYRVLPASTGAEALALVEREAAPPDALVSDVVMPTMGGVELAERLHALHPRIRILLVSGYSDRSPTPNVPADCCAHLGKPFQPDDLLGRLDALLKG